MLFDALKSALLRTIGILPPDLRQRLEGEGLVLLDEKFNTVIKFRKYRSTRARFGARRQGGMGFVALTDERFFGSGYSVDYVDLPFELIRPDTLSVSVANGGCLKLSFEASDFHDDRSGRIECRYYTPRARLFAERLRGVLERSVAP